MSRGGLGICDCYFPVLTITFTSSSWIQCVPSSVTFTSCYQTRFIEVTVLQNDGSSPRSGNISVAEFPIGITVRQVGNQGNASPALISPANGALTADSVAFVWHITAQPDRYRFQLATDSLFTSPIIDDSTLTDTTTSVTQLQQNQTYWWKVRGHNVATGWGPFSETRSFLVDTSAQLPAQVSLVSPTDGTMIISDSLTFVWHAVQSIPDVDRYWFFRSTDPLFASFVSDSTITDTTTTNYLLHDNETYYWKVRAHNIAGWGPFSDVWSFSVLITGVEADGQIPTVYSLSQNYPNPFNPSTVIRYGLPQKAHVRLEVFNVLGQTVALLVDEDQGEGYHEVKFDATGLATGLYLYRVKSGEFVQTKKLIVLK